jgi:hypothetical protein
MNARIIIALALLPVLASCTSPIDVPTARIDTTLTNRIKLRDITVNALIQRVPDTLTIDAWSHTTPTSEFAVDSIGAPPSLTMNCRLQASPTQSSSATSLKELRIRLDNLPAQGTAQLGTDPTIGSGVAATVIVDNTEYATGAGTTASAALFYIQTDKKRVQGTIVIGLNHWPLFNLVVAVNFTASQD